MWAALGESDLAIAVAVALTTSLACHFIHLVPQQRRMKLYLITIVAGGLVTAYLYASWFLRGFPDVQSVTNSSFSLAINRAHFAINFPNTEYYPRAPLCAPDSETNNKPCLIAVPGWKNGNCWGEWLQRDCAFARMDASLLVLPSVQKSIQSIINNPCEFLRKDKEEFHRIALKCDSKEMTDLFIAIYRHNDEMPISFLKIGVRP